MAKKLYSVALRFVQIFITNNRSKINTIIKDNSKYEYAKVLGRSHYEIYIQRFIEEFKINKEMDYAVKILNQYKSYTFIYDFYKLLNLDRFEKPQNDENAKKDHQKNIFFCFIYYLSTIPNTQKEDLENRLFRHYFLHKLAGINQSTKIELNFKNLCEALVKGKETTIKESFKVEDEKAIFKILVNHNPHIELLGVSIKTLRKRAYKQLFYDLIDQKI
jgi:hypothetical protein